MTGKEVTKTETSNKSNELALYDSIVEQWHTDAVTFKSERQRKLCHYLALGVNPRQAAYRAGYSDSYANAGVYKKLKLDKEFVLKISQLKSNFKETYLKFAQDCLPEVAWIERKILSQLAENPAKINPTTAKVMRDLKRSAGVLVDEQLRPEVVNVQVLLQVQDQLKSAYDEAEIVEVPAKEIN